MGFLLLSDHTDLQLSDRDVAVGTVEMRVHPGTGLQFQKVFICVERPDSREGRIEVAHDRLCASAQNLSRMGWLGKSSAHISANTGLTCLCGANFLRLLAVLDIGIRPIPSNDVSRLVMQRYSAEQKPAIVAVKSAHARFRFIRCSRSQACAPFLHEVCEIFGMNCDCPAP